MLCLHPTAVLLESLMWSGVGVVSFVRLLVVPWADPNSHHQFHRFSTDLGVHFLCLFLRFLYKCPPIEFNIVFYRM